MGRVVLWFGNRGHKSERLGQIQASLHLQCLTLVNMISLSLIFFIRDMEILRFFFIPLLCIY